MKEKYTIVKNNDDDYSLKYGETELKFHSNVALAKEVQDVPRRARINLIMDLSAQGKSLASLDIETKKDGKTYIDSSNREQLEEIYMDQEYERTFNKCITEMVGKTFNEIMLEIGLTTEEEALKLGEELGSILAGNFPRW